MLTTKDGLSSNVILALAEDAKGTLLIGTPDGLNRLDKRGGISVMTSADGLAEDFVRSIFVDRDGTVWVSTRQGLSRLEANRAARSYTEADGLGSALVGALLRDREGDLDRYASWADALSRRGISELHGSRWAVGERGDGSV